jgi:multidrug efflux pump subunit AcrB
MGKRTSLSLLIALLLLPTVASAQVRYQPPQRISRLETRPLKLRESPYRIAIADSVRRESYWQKGLWIGVVTGVILGTVVAIDNGGERASASEKLSNAFVLSGFFGVPLGVIGAMIGDAAKK